MKHSNNLKKERSAINVNERISGIENKLIQLSSDLGCKDELNQIFSKERYDSYSLINAEIIFLLDEGEGNESEILAKWLSVDEQEIQSGNSVDINLEKVAINFKFYDYNNKPVRKVSDAKPLINIIIYSNAYSEKEALNLILKEVSVNTSCCILVSLKENDSEIQSNKISLFTNALHVLSFQILELQNNQIVDLINSEDFKRKLKLIKWFNRINDLSLASELLGQKLKSQAQLVLNRHILNQKELLKYQLKEGEITSKDIGAIKVNISKGYKSAYRIIEQLKSELERKGEDSFIDEMKSYVDNHDKFIEDKKGKNTLLLIPEGVQKDVINKTVSKVQKDLDKCIVSLREKLSLIEKEIQQQFKELAIASPILPSKTLSNSVTNDVVSEHMVLEKKYEKSMTPKGLSHLFSEIRTPLFMVMPLMMFVGIFGSFFISEDVGSISPETEYNGRNAIIIDALPEKYKEKKYRYFAENQIFGRNGQRILKKIDDDGSVFQLAMREVPIRKKVGNKYKTTIELKNDFEIENDKLILFLRSPKGDRSWVVAQLMDPDNNLLAISDSSKGGGGMGMLYSLGSMFGKYRFIALGVIVSLFSWFIKSKLSEFKEEGKYMMSQNKEALTNDLKGEIDKMVKKSTTVWSSEVVGHIKKQEDMQQEVVSNTITKVIEDNKEQLKEQIAIVQRRASNFENEEKQNNDFNKDLNQIQNDLASIRKKFRELIYA